MEYADMHNIMIKSKGTRQNETMKVISFGRFSVLSREKMGDIIVDNDIAEEIKHRLWCDSQGYPVTRIKDELIRLHDYVMSRDYNTKPVNCYVDHINHDKYDNRRINLRFVNPEESVLNMPLRADNTTGITGVSKGRNGIGYRAYITVNKKRIELGTYQDIREAQAARMIAEMKYGFKTRTGKPLDYFQQDLKVERSGET